jgi:hypothetical protein
MEVFPDSKQQIQGYCVLWGFLFLLIQYSGTLLSSLCLPPIPTDCTRNPINKGAPKTHKSNLIGSEEKGFPFTLGFPFKNCFMVKSYKQTHFS